MELKKLRPKQDGSKSKGRHPATGQTDAEDLEDDNDASPRDREVPPPSKNAGNN